MKGATPMLQFANIAVGAMMAGIGILDASLGHSRGAVLAGTGVFVAALAASWKRP